MVQLHCERERTLDFVAARTALACIDFQTDFLSPDGMCAARSLPVDRLARALAPAQLALQSARQSGLFIFHTREAYAPDLSDLNAFRRRYDKVVGSQGPLGRFLVRGEAGTEIVDSMAPMTGEPVIDKPGFNAFSDTALATILRARGIDTLILMGLTTQCCVASTHRAAVDLGYACVLLKDASAAYDPADHEATVRVVYSENHNFGWVSDSERLAHALRETR